MPVWWNSFSRRVDQQVPWSVWCCMVSVPSCSHECLWINIWRVETADVPFESGWTGLFRFSVDSLHCWSPGVIAMLTWKPQALCGLWGMGKSTIHKRHWKLKGGFLLVLHEETYKVPTKFQLRRCALLDWCETPAVNQSRAFSITLGLVLLAIGALVHESCFAADLNVAAGLDFVG